MEQSFSCQGKTWTRRTFPDIPVKVTRYESESRYCPSDSVTWTGTHILSDGERELTVSKSTVCDAGALGASVTYSGASVRPKGRELDRVLSGMGYRRGA